MLGREVMISKNYIYHYLQYYPFTKRIIVAICSMLVALLIAMEVDGMSAANVLA